MAVLLAHDQHLIVHRVHREPQGVCSRGPLRRWFSSEGRAVGGPAVDRDGGEAVPGPGRSRFSANHGLAVDHVDRNSGGVDQSRRRSNDGPERGDVAVRGPAIDRDGSAFATSTSSFNVSTARPIGWRARDPSADGPLRDDIAVRGQAVDRDGSTFATRIWLLTVSTSRPGGP